MITMVQNLDAIPIPNINMAEAELELKNFKNVPITAMSHQTRLQLSSLLNARKYLRTEEGYYRDWRGIGQLTNQGNFFDESAISGSDPTSKVLEHWQNCNPKEANFETLQIFLGKIDRWDASDDIYENLVEDAKKYKIRQRNFETRSATLAATKTKHSGVPTEHELDVLTVHDAQLFAQDLPPQIYDAFLLYVDCDAPHAAQIKSFLEEKCNLKICTKDYLLAGKLFVHKALTQLIDQRCNRLIVILTREFRKSGENDFYMNYVQAEQIYDQNVKLIPLLYEDDVDIPRTLRHITHLKASSYMFWERLNRSVTAEMKMPTTTNSVPSITNNNQLSLNNHLENQISNLPTPPIDIPSINITLVQDENDASMAAAAASSAPVTTIKETRYHKKHTIANGTYMGNNHNNNNKSNHMTIDATNNLNCNNNNNNNNINNNKNENLSSKFMQVKGFVLRHAHSTSQLNGKNYKETYPSSSDLSISSQCSETRKMKKKKKFSTKFLKRVFSRSNTKLQTAV